MNRKGFTLVEVMAVIVLLGIILAIAVPSVVKINKKNNERELEIKRETLLSEAELYGQDYPSIFDSTGLAKITVKQLLTNGYTLSDVSQGSRECEEEKGCVVNPVTKESMNDEVIYIKKNVRKVQALWEEEFPTLAINPTTIKISKGSSYEILLTGISTNQAQTAEEIKEKVLISENNVIIPKANGYKSLELGIHNVKYEVSDEIGNQENKQRTIEVVEDPTLSIDPKEATITYGSVYDLLTGVNTNQNKASIEIKEGSIAITSSQQLSIGTHTLTYRVLNNAINPKAATETRTIIVVPSEKTFAYSQTNQEYRIGATGTYEIEGYGAQGGSFGTTAIGGKGGYIKGRVRLTEGTIVVVNTGGQNGYNGGGQLAGAQPGGGSSTIKIKSTGEYLLIAAGGGGSGLYESASYIGGAGGSGTSTGGIVARSGGTAGVNGTTGGGGSSSLNKEYTCGGGCASTGTCGGECTATGTCGGKCVAGTKKVCQESCRKQNCNPLLKPDQCYCDKQVKCSYVPDACASKTPTYSCCKSTAPTYPCCTSYYPTSTCTAYGNPGMGGTSTLGEGVTQITKTDGIRNGNGWVKIAFKAS